MAEIAAGVHQRGDRVFLDDLRARREIEAAFAALRLVGHEHRDAVRVDTDQIGLEHHIRRRCGEIVGHAPRLQDEIDLFAHPLGPCIEAHAVRLLI